MTKRILLTLLGFFLLIGTAFGSGPLKDGSLSAESDGSNITVRWMSEDETGVASFELERKAGLYGQFFLLSVLSPKGDNSIYEYVDDTALRVGAESIYEYRVKVILSNGTAVYSPEVTVVHAVSSVRRTWGSIKAMFR
jgi:hypothetical protein